jgi:hypothetical protein
LLWWLIEIATTIELADKTFYTKKPLEKSGGFFYSIKSRHLGGETDIASPQKKVNYFALHVDAKNNLSPLLGGKINIIWRIAGETDITSPQRKRNYVALHVDAKNNLSPLLGGEKNSI